jgi:hypothetical protein
MANPWENMAPALGDVSARRIDESHPLDLYWARDHLGRYLFIYEMPYDDAPATARMPSLVGVDTLYMPAGSGTSTARLILVLNETGNWELFYALCNDLVRATSASADSRHAVDTIIRRLNRWQEFLRRQRSDILTAEKIRGLIAELIFLKNHLIPAFGAGSAVQFWQGPQGSPQDFNVNVSAIEVKCKLGSTAPHVTITSADQLCPQLPKMYLFVVTLGNSAPDAPDAINLPDLVAEIRSALETENPNTVERFNDLLFLVGYVDSDNYREFSFVVVDQTMFRVAEGFPRVCPADVHPGIVRLSYDIRLADCASFEGTPDWMGALR